MLTYPRTNPVRASSRRSSSGVPDNLLTNRSTSNAPTRCRSQSRDDVRVKVADRTTSRARSACRGVAVGAVGRGDTARDGVAAGADARGAGVTDPVADTVGGGALYSEEPPQLTSSGTASRSKPARIIWCSFLPAGLARPAESRPYPGTGCLRALARREYATSSSSPTRSSRASTTTQCILGARPDEGDLLLAGVVGPPDQSVGHPAADVHGALYVLGDRHAVDADLHDQMGSDGERSAPTSLREMMNPANTVGFSAPVARVAPWRR